MCFLSLALGIITFADDVIVLKNGDVLNGNVIEISSDAIKYKKSSNPNGPTYITNLKEVLSIKYSNGDVEKFNNINDETSSYGLIEITPADDNQALIQSHNHSYTYIGEKSEKKAYFHWDITHFAKESILKTAEIEINFLGGPLKKDMTIFNNSNNIIVVDLTNTFQISYFGNPNNPETQSIVHRKYRNETTAETEGASKGIGVNMGGITNALGIGGVIGSISNHINLGGGSTSSKTTLHTNERFVSIPPHTNYVIGDAYYSLDCGYYSDIKLNVGETIRFDEESSPNHIILFITYSNKPDFSSYHLLKIHTYLAESHGISKKSWKNLTRTSPNPDYSLIDFFKERYLRYNDTSK